MLGFGLSVCATIVACSPEHQINSSSTLPSAAQKKTGLLATPAPPATDSGSARDRAKPLSFTQGSDSSNDICRSWCVIAGQSIKIYANNWGSVAPANAKSVQLMIANAPSGVSITWNPVSPSGPSYTSQLGFSVSNTSLTPSEVYPYDYYAIWTLTDGTTTTTAMTPELIDVACSLNAKTCPHAQIADNTVIPAKAISGSPPPLTAETAGLGMDLIAQWQSGTGLGGTFSVDTTDSNAGQLQWSTGDPIWQSGNILQSYALTVAGENPVSVSSSNLTLPEVKFFIKRAVNANGAGDLWHAQVPLVRSDGNEHSNEVAAINLNVLLPQVTNMIAVSAYGPTFAVIKPSPGPSYEAFGVTVSSDYAATTPSTSGGLFAVLQTVQTSNWSFIPGPTPPNTNGAVDLDTCLSYGDVLHANSNSKVDLNASSAGEVDSPSLQVVVTNSSETAVDYSNDYFLFQPDPVKASGSQRARPAYWVPLAVSWWNWGATASATPAPVHSPPLPITYTLSNKALNTSGQGDTTYNSYPYWNQIYAPSDKATAFPTSQPAGCATIPQ